MKTSSGAELFNVDGWTDRLTDGGTDGQSERERDRDRYERLIIALCNFSNVPKGLQVS